MEFKPFSLVHTLMQLVLVVVLLGGNFLYGSWFFKKIEPGVKLATETRLNVSIERNILGSWTLAAKSSDDYQGNKFLLHMEVFAVQFGLLMLFVAGFLLEIILLILFFRRLYKGG